MKTPHFTTIALRWSDLDALGHVNNAVYFTYIEQARLDWFHQVLNYELDTSQQGPVVASAHCDFKRATHYPGALIIETTVSSVRTRSFELHHQLRSQQTQDIHAHGTVTLVWIDYPQGKAVKLPSALHDELNNLSTQAP